ncbi:MAG: cysteine desulfurase [Clostridia bacterium]|nr:cysteine desulfurase [Clostridia bacterium]
MIYLDHAATTPPDAAVIRAMDEAMAAAWHNPGAAYATSEAPRRILRKARQTVAGMLNARPQEVLFTSGGTEGNNQAASLARNGHAVVGAVEHASVLNAARHFAREVTLVPPDACGRVLPGAVAAALRPDTRLICVQFANNETGVLQPVADIGALARSRRIPFLCDGVQAFGKMPIDVQALNIDLLTLSAHKFHGPRGVGALYVRQGIPLEPLLRGGGQEFGLRSGTENVAAVEGLRVAAEQATRDMDAHKARVRTLAEGFVSRLKALVPDCRLLAEGAPRLEGVMATLLPGLSSEQAVADLDLLGIQVSAGAACAARTNHISHVYRAMGLSDADARCVIRVSLGRENTAAEMNTAAERIAEVYERRRETSKF